MAHAQKPGFVIRRNGRVHLNRRGRHFSRLLAAEVCALTVVMLYTPCSEVVWRVLATHSIRQFPLHPPPLVRLRVPSHFNWSLLHIKTKKQCSNNHMYGNERFRGLTERLHSIINTWSMVIFYLPWHSATNRKGAGSIPACVIGNFHWNKILPIALWHWGRLSL